MQLQRFLQVREGFFFRLTLAGDIDLKALRDIPITLTPHGRRKWPFHSSILALHVKPNKVLAVAKMVFFSVLLIGGGVLLCVVGKQRAEKR